MPEALIYIVPGVVLLLLGLTKMSHPGFGEVYAQSEFGEFVSVIAGFILACIGVLVAAGSVIVGFGLL